MTAASIEPTQGGRRSSFAELEARPHPQSMVDPRGRLFVSGDRMLRGIRAEYAETYRALFSRPDVEELYERGLVRTSITELQADQFPLVLEHRRVAFNTEWHEWPSLMLRDAAIAICDLNEALIERGLGIHDLHPWNVLFDGPRPVYVDVGAINPLPFFQAQADPLWIWILRRHWILPLTLMSLGLPGLARTVGRHQDFSEPIDVFLRRRPLRLLPPWYYRLARTAAAQPARFFRRLRAKLERLPLGSAAPSTPSVPAAREQALRPLLKQLRPATLLSVGSGAERQAVLAARLGYKVVALDAEEAGANRTYLEARTQRLDILSLFGDFTLPSQRHGRKYEFRAATERLVCDITVLTGLLPRLALRHGVPFERIADLVAAHSTRHAIVELDPLDHGGELAEGARAPEWYTAKSLVGAMTRHFRLEHVFAPGGSAPLYLFSR